MERHSQQAMQAMQRLTTIYLCASGLRPMLAFLFGAAAGPLRAIAGRLCRLRSVSPLSTYAPPPPRPVLAFLFGAAAGPSRAIASRLCRLCSVTPLSTCAPPPPRPTLALLFGTTDLDTQAPRPQTVSCQARYAFAPARWWVVRATTCVGVCTTYCTRLGE